MIKMYLKELFIIYLKINLLKNINNCDLNFSYYKKILFNKY